MVAERWTRPAEIAAAYAALPDEDDPEYLAQLSKASLELEVVIIARRATENERLRRRINSIAAERALPIIHAAAVGWGGVPEWEYDEVRSVARFMFWEEIAKGESYFEVDFLNAAITIAKRAGDRVWGRKKRQRDRDALARIHRSKLEGAGCRAAGAFGGRAGVRRAVPERGAVAQRRSARLGGAEGAGARVREACAGMLARASDPCWRCERASGRER